MDNRLSDPVWDGLPESVIRKMVRAVTGTKDLSSTTQDQREAIRDALVSTYEADDTYRHWRARAFGLLRQRGYAR